MSESLLTGIFTATNTDQALEQYQFIMEAARCSVFTLDSAGHFVAISPSITTLSGFEVADLIGQAFLDLVAPQARTQVQDLLVRRVDQLEACEFPLRTRDNTWLWVRYTMMPIHHDGNNFYQCLIQDITEQRQQAYERILRNRAIEASSSGVLIADARVSEMPVIYVNPAFEQITGHKADEVIGRSCLFLRADERDQAKVGQIKAALQAGGSVQVTLRNYRKNGDMFWNELSFSPIYNGPDTLTHYVGISVDVSAQKNAEQALARERNLLRTLIDNIPDYIHAKNRDGIYILSNKAHARFLGAQSPSEVVDKSAEAFLPPQMAQQYAQEDAFVLRTGQSILNAERSGLPQSGAARWLSSTKVPLRNEQGEVVGVIGIARDMTDTKQQDGVLKQREEMYRTLARNLPNAGVFLYDQKLRLLAAEGQALDPEYFSPEQIKGLLISEVLPDNAPSADPVDIFQAALSGEEIVVERQYDGIFFSLHILPVRNVAGEIFAGMVLIQNIDEQKRLYQELSHHVEDLTILSQVDTELADNLNINYVVRMALDAAVRLGHAHSGYIATLEDDGALILSTFIGDYDAVTLQNMLHQHSGIIGRVLRTQQAERILDLSKDPDYVALLPDTYEVMVLPLISHEQLVGVMTLEAEREGRFTEERFQFVRLVTGRIAAYLDNANLHQQTEQQVIELQKLYEEIRKLEQLKTDMLRIASHDLKNPLSGITGYVELLQRDAQTLLDETSKRYLKNIEDAARRMDRITKGILSLERIEQMAKQQNRERFDLAALLRDSVDEQIDGAHRKQQLIAKNILKHKVLVQGDSLQVREALANLISNAIKYTPERGQIEIRLIVEVGYAKVRVRDTGTGIPEEEQQRLFTPFFRGKDHRKSKIEGTGLGLHLVKNIVDRHNGTLFFSSRVGEGSVFGFDLPLADQSDDEDDDDDLAVTGSTVIR